MCATLSLEAGQSLWENVPTRDTPGTLCLGASLAGHVAPIETVVSSERTVREDRVLVLPETGESPYGSPNPEQDFDSLPNLGGGSQVRKIKT